MQQGLGMDRRRFLRCMGAAIGLPAFESFASDKALAKSGPLRMAYLYVPNGVNLKHWRPQGKGRDFTFGKSMSALEPLRDDLQIYTGFAHREATAGGDGAGDHARSNATFLTGARAKKTAGSDIRAGISVDQMAARAVQQETRLSSLELTCDGVRKSGRCDSGYSCAYQFNLSWRSATQPNTPEANPRLVFERLFGAGTGEERAKNLAQRRASQKSILDFIASDAKSMHRELGRNDQLKLDEYLTGIREIERQIEKSETLGPPIDPEMESPAGQPKNYQEHMRLLMDMMVLAFQTDSTRISTFLLAHDGSNRSFQEIGVAEGHHSISHHKKKAENLAKLQKIDEFYLQQLAYFMSKMKETKDLGGQSLLHNSMIVYGSGISDGNRHKHSDLPVIVGGHAGGGFQPGRHVDLGQEVPLSNLYLRMLHEFGVKADRFGDSTGVLKNI